LITKEPTEKRELSFLSNLNQTHALDLSGFYAEKYKNNIGITFLPLVTFRKLMM
jgi:iron complex outermembrane receptor protein